MIPIGRKFDQLLKAMVTKPDMKTLNQARKDADLKTFIKERQDLPKGNLHAIDKIIQSPVSETSTKGQVTSKRKPSGDCT